MILAFWQIVALVFLVPLAFFFLVRWLWLINDQELDDAIKKQTVVQKPIATAPMPYYMQLQLAQHQKKLFDVSHSSTYQQFSKKQDYS